MWVVKVVWVVRVGEGGWVVRAARVSRVVTLVRVVLVRVGRVDLVQPGGVRKMPQNAAKFHS